MIILKDKATEASLGTITEEQLQFLREQLEEETEEDRDYWIDRDTLDLLRARGGDPDLIALIQRGMGDRDDIEVVWEES